MSIELILLLVIVGVLIFDFVKNSRKGLDNLLYL